MEKSFEEVKQELEQILQNLYDREEVRPVHDKMNKLTEIKLQIETKNKEYQKAINNENFEAAVEIKHSTESLELHRDILSKEVAFLKTQIDDYPHEEVLKICDLESQYYKNYVERMMNQILSLLIQIDQKSDELYKEYLKYKDFQRYLSHKSEKCPEASEFGYKIISDFAKNYVPDVSMYIIEMKKYLAK